MLMLIILWCDTAEQNKETDPHICIHICLRMKTGEININIILQNCGCNMTTDSAPRRKKFENAHFVILFILLETGGIFTPRRQNSAVC